MTPKRPEFKPIYNLMTQGYLPAIVNNALDAGIFTALEKGPATAEILAERLGGDRQILLALLDVLSAIRLVCRKRNRYCLTPEAKSFLLESSPLAQVMEIRAFFRHPGPFDDLFARLKKGPPAYDPGMFTQRRVIRNMEQRARGGQLQEVVEFIRALPDFSSFGLMCDFAGSSGYYSMELVKKNPKLRSRVYDSPEVAALARDMAGRNQDSKGLKFLGIDMEACRDFGGGYDLFFVSHFLYHLNASGRLPRFFRKVNRALNPGGFFVSNHTCSAVEHQDYLTQSIIELLARTQGYPTLNLGEAELKSALSLAGFGDFRIRPAKNGTYLNNLLMSAKKIKEI